MFGAGAIMLGILLLVLVVVILLRLSAGTSSK